MGETSAAGGRVTVAAAKGKNGKRFRTLGKAKINSKGVFKLRFRLARGTYRMRYSFKGSSTVARGTVYRDREDQAHHRLATRPWPSASRTPSASASASASASLRSTARTHCWMCSLRIWNATAVQAPCRRSVFGPCAR